MKHALSIYLLAASAVILAGCGMGQRERAEWIERGGKELAPFKAELMGALMAALQDGTEAAIEVCQLKAPEIEKKLSSDAVAIGRTSHKLRNPGNAPKPWMKPLLQKYLANPKQHLAEVVRLDNGGIGYAEPIFVQSNCLACHGSDLEPDVAALIDELYPADQARGFAEGDFRGMFWVEFAAQ